MRNTVAAGAMRVPQHAGMLGVRDRKPPENQRADAARMRASLTSLGPHWGLYSSACTLVLLAGPHSAPHTLVLPGQDSIGALSAPD